jgi:hypothetical protein
LRLANEMARIVSGKDQNGCSILVPLIADNLDIFDGKKRDQVKAID